MGTKGKFKHCKFCGKIFKSSRYLHVRCANCKNISFDILRRTKKCPKCGKLIQQTAEQCRECRWKPFRKNHICPKCGKKKATMSKHCFACASKIKIGPNHPCWKGGRFFNDAGYVMTYAPGHPRCGNNNYVREHIKIWMDKHGEISPGHVIHHLNGIKHDNRIENLKLLPIKKHKSDTLIGLLQKRIQELESLLNNQSP